jgi:hypothetical protein
MVAGLEVGAAVRGCAPGRLSGLMRLARHALQAAGPDAGEGMPLQIVERSTIVASAIGVHGHKMPHGA